MKIIIDGRFLGPEGFGIGAYVDNLLENLLELDNKNEYIIFLRKANFHLFNPSKDNFKKILVHAHWYSAKEQLLIPLALYKENPDLVHFPHFNVPLAWKGRFVVTIHDLTLSKYGKEIARSNTNPIYPAKRLFYNSILRKAVNSSDKILTPSSFVKEELLENFDIPGEKVVVTHEAADELFLELNKENISEGEKKKVLATYGIKEPYTLTVGNSYPYKNIKIVIESLPKLSKDLSLVHVSNRDRFSDKLTGLAKNLGVDKRFILTGYVPVEDLAILYRFAKVFIFPSLSEGFGLPGLEAMASGCPVVCSDIPVFREVYGESVLYFNPNDDEDVAKVINELLENQALKKKLVRLGFRQARKYSWKKLTEQTLQVYNSV